MEKTFIQVKHEIPARFGRKGVAVRFAPIDQQLTPLSRRIYCHQERIFEELRISKKLCNRLSEQRSDKTSFDNSDVGDSTIRGRGALFLLLGEESMDSFI